jgi:hypothetical protein
MLYKKQIHSLEELQQERILIKQGAQKKLNSLKAKSQNRKSATIAEKVSLISSGLLKNTKFEPYIDIASKLIVPYLVEKGVEKTAKKVGFSLLKNVGVGYFKWQIIHFTGKFIWNQVQKKTNKKSTQV